MKSMLDDNEFTKMLLAVLLAKLKLPQEEVEITQADVDGIAYTRLLEGWNNDSRAFCLKIDRGTKQ